MKANFRITPRAYADLKSIARYTRQQWGENQRLAYLRGLHERFAWLAEHPRAGKARPDLADGYSCYPHDAHLIFYLIRDDGIDIIGIPHKQMDVLSHFA